MRHFYSVHPRMAPDIQERGIDLFTPIWHFIDLTPAGPRRLGDQPFLRNQSRR